MQETTIAAIATAPGAGGIAVVRLSGAESYPIAARVFRPANAAKKVEDAKGYTAMYGTFREGDEAFDEGVALFFRAPHSYTGEDVVELSCHGGSAVSARLLRACCAAGAAPAGPGEFTKRAFLSGRISLTQAEAVMDLINATSRQAAAAAAAPVEEKTEFDVVMTEFGAEKIKVIKEVRGLLGLGLAEAKAIVEAVPAKLKEGVSKEEGEEIKSKLEAVGAKVELK